MALNCSIEFIPEYERVIDYPCLMEYTGPSFPDNKRIVLAIEEGTGIDMINDHNQNTVGAIQYGFINFSDEIMWKPYNGSVTFSNK